MNRAKLKEALRPIVRETLSDYLKDTQEDMRALQKAHPQLDMNDTPVEQGLKKEVEEEVVEEANTTNGNPGMAYQTPYAFSDVGIERDAKKRKIAQQLGYKLVEKKRLKEEVAVNITKAVPLLEDFKPVLRTPLANKLYMGMLDYLLFASDPQYKRIHMFRKAIDSIKDSQDKKQLIQAFNDEFKISWGTASQSAWEYYKDA